MKVKYHSRFNKELNEPIKEYKEAINTYQIEDLANRTYSKQAYVYYNSGAMNHESYIENEKAFKRYKILPKCLVKVSDIDISTELLGEKISVPICIAPTAMHNLCHFRGEVETAIAANELDTIMCLSTMTSCSMGDVAKTLNKKWKQLYMLKDLNAAEKTIKMIESYGYTTIVLTVDAPSMGIRDLENKGKFDGPAQRLQSKNTKQVESGMGQFFGRTFNSVIF